MSAPDIKQLSDQAFSLVEQGRLQESVALFGRLCAQAPDNATAWMMQGTIKAELGDAQGAHDCLTRAIALDPSDAEAHYMLCRVYQAQGRLSDAITMGRKAVTLADDYGEAWLALSGVCGLAGRFADAEQCARRAIELMPDSVDGAANLANTLRMQGRLDEAVQLYEQTVEHYPNNADLQYCLGLTFLLQARVVDAERHLSRAIELAPGHAPSQYCLGDVRRLQQRLDDAVRHYQRAIDIDPRCTEAHIRLGIALLDSGSPQKLEILRALEPDHRYADAAEAGALARRLAGHYAYPDQNAQQSLIHMFSEFDPAQLYPSAWWQSKLSTYGVRESGHDKCARGVLSSVFCVSIPSREALEAISRFADGTRLFSYGAGTGYWEYLMRAHCDANVVASDRNLCHRFIEMRQLDYADAGFDPADTLFLSWIPGWCCSSDAASAQDVITLWQQMSPGQRLVLVGEPPDERGVARSCANDAIFEFLRGNFEHRGTIPLVQFSYVSDTVELYTRK